MEVNSIAIIGCGNMASCIIHGLVSSGYPPANIWVTNPSEAKLQPFRQMGINTTCDNSIAYQKPKTILLAVKPKIISTVCSEIKESIAQQEKLIISVAAGIQLNKLSAILGANHSLVRAMPNIPARHKLAATGLSALNLQPWAQEITETIFSSIGQIFWFTKEEQLDIVTALAGSGPAYFFCFMEALIAAGIKMGLEPEAAKLMTVQTALGAATMAANSNDSLSYLREQVTSKGGTTECGLAALMGGDIFSIMQRVLVDAHNRAQELSNL